MEGRNEQLTSWIDARGTQIQDFRQRAMMMAITTMMMTLVDVELVPSPRTRMPPLQAGHCITL